MYTDLAEAVEDLKEKGVRDLSSEDKMGEDIRSGKVPNQLKKMKILETFRFEAGTDPGDESTLYLLELPDKSKGYLILGFGIYQDPEKSALVEVLKKLEQD